jgi:hypothetical protein
MSPNSNLRAPPSLHTIWQVLSRTLEVLGQSREQRQTSKAPWPWVSGYYIVSFRCWEYRHVYLTRVFLLPQRRLWRCQHWSTAAVHGRSRPSCIVWDASGFLGFYSSTPIHSTLIEPLVLRHYLHLKRADSLPTGA